MINYWFIPRPKRKLNTVPDVLATFSGLSLDIEWYGQIDTQLSLEEALEEAGLKRVGERRDQSGSGARTYRAWLESIGLLFTHESTHQTKLTLAGEAIIAGESPVKIIKNQLLKFQYPSPYSLNRNVNIAPRFKIRPFRFILKLLKDSRIKYLTQEEIGKIVITEAINESDKCYEYVVRKISDFRTFKDNCLAADFAIHYAPNRGSIDYDNPYDHLLDCANTIINWIEYTQLAKRDDAKKLRIVEEKEQEVQDILSDCPLFISNPEQEEVFQRKYGLDLKHTKDTRNLVATNTVTTKLINEMKVKKAFVVESLKTPIAKITVDLADSIAEKTGLEYKIVEETLLKYYPHGAIGAFMTEYYEMAFKGRDEATEFEKATVSIFSDVFGFETEHIGPIGLTPDVYIISRDEQFVGIIDNKAYSKYSISNDHRNRMVHNYIQSYSNKEYPLAFFSYVSGGFGGNIDFQIKDIADETNVNGSCINVINMINLIEKHDKEKITQRMIKRLFSINRQITSKDIMTIE